MMQSADLPPSIFLSHSAHDGEFAKFFASEIERVFSKRHLVFVSSRPDALESGEEWRPRVIENLKKAAILIVLLTRASEISSWVGFEAGYFWHKQEGGNIHVLRHPEVAIPNPIDTIQAKLITSEDELTSFFSNLSITLTYTDGLDLRVAQIVEMAKTIEARIPERSLRYFEKMLLSSTWEKLVIEHTPTLAEIIDLFTNGELNIPTRDQVWVCTDDVVLQIVEDYSTKDEFTEEWIKNISIYSVYKNKDKFAYSYSVYLALSGARIKEMTFISLDGGKYLVPLPSIKPASIDSIDEDTPPKYFWSRDSLEYIVGLVIGKFFRENSLDDFAKSIGITVE
ncbi:MAG: toll/interleukin-1 receptor domain-containing protein [Chloroflexota bacterium]